MTRLPKEDYRNAIGILKRYNYNCISILNIRADIMSLSSLKSDGMPNTPYSVSDNVFNQYVRLQEDKELQKCLKEYKVVVQALALLTKDSKYIFEQEYIKSKSKWEIIDSGMSERTYERRKRDLVYAVHKEIKKNGGKLAEFY